MLKLSLPTKIKHPLDRPEGPLGLCPVVEVCHIRISTRPFHRSAYHSSGPTGSPLSPLALYTNQLITEATGHSGPSVRVFRFAQPLQLICSCALLSRRYIGLDLHRLSLSQYVDKPVDTGFSQDVETSGGVAGGGE